MSECYLLDPTSLTIAPGRYRSHISQAEMSLVDADELVEGQLRLFKQEFGLQVLNVL